jgi:hypothetical protein
VRFPFPWSFHRPVRHAQHAPTGPDPIDHPAIAAMSLRELADLPLWRPTASEEVPPDFRPRAKRETAWSELLGLEPFRQTLDQPQRPSPPGSGASALASEGIKVRRRTISRECSPAIIP